ncbi:MAG: hypothetical protein HKO53_17060, partial [Gemmatimonadetes bacterium]|nr:hypothetical protein [Gemmatimonadota bacterium]
MFALIALWSVVGLAPGAATLEERLDRYDPATGAYLGAETTAFAPDGRRLRWTITDAEGQPDLIFFVTHDSTGREAQALYFEGDPAEQPTREVFTWSDDGRTQTTTYYYEPGVPSERTDSFRDESGREVRKAYYRKDGTQYGKEVVLWNDDGTKLGWDFSYVSRE